ncbi:hypothetical protein DL98DRAFT_553136 [Cadophora sp. DSE1049]|nr:hypothetical protein DL98DRAFT_553136 [Cadophora sp. DSE1049]
MASIGKLALSLANAAQETTLALAHFSFDFALIKMEAPAEFQGLGSRLSKRRKLEAEEGLVHTTAPINPTGTASDGPLASHVGLDGTSIWAAATSGRGALQVHLLACILARVWSGPEAVSIWSELVAARKAHLEERLKEDQFHMGLLMASRIDVGLEKLGEWDASARAWLSAADKAKLLQQKQLMLVIDNIGIQIRAFPRLYDSVLNVWIKALETMEKLVSGIAQSVESPEILLGFRIFQGGWK